MATTRINGYQQFTTTGDVSFNNQKIINLATPTSGADAVNKDYVDGLVQGLDIKGSVRAATVSNIVLSGIQTIDNIPLSSGDRVLVKNQTTKSQNGIYTIGVGAWIRSIDADNGPTINSNVSTGMYSYVEEGLVNGGTSWSLVTTGLIALDTTPLTFVQFSGASTLTAGEGLVADGNVFNVVSADETRIVVNADNIDLAAAGSNQGQFGSNDYSTKIYNVPYINIDAYGRTISASSINMFPNKIKNTVFAGPITGIAAAPGFRVLDILDVLVGLTGDTNTIVPTIGQLLIANNSGKFIKNTLTPGTGITIDSSTTPGTVSITNDGVTSINTLTGALTNVAFTNAANIFIHTSGQTIRTAAIQDGILLTGRAGGTSSYTTTFIPGVLTSSTVLTTPTSSGYIALTPLATGLMNTLSISTENLIFSVGSSYNGQVATSISVDGVTTSVIKAWKTVTTGSITIGEGLTSGILNLGTGTSATIASAINIGNGTNIARPINIGLPLTISTVTGVIKFPTIAHGTLSGFLKVAPVSGLLSLDTNLYMLADASVTYTSKQKFKDSLSTIASPGTKTTVNWNGNGTVVATPIGSSTIPVFIYSSPIVLGSECIYVNGILQEPGGDYNISGLSIIFLTGSVPQVGDKVLVNYIIA